MALPNFPQVADPRGTVQRRPDLAALIFARAPYLLLDREGTPYVNDNSGLTGRWQDEFQRRRLKDTRGDVNTRK